MIEEFKQHCISEYPNEACGVVIGGAFYPVKNAHHTPRTHFKMSAADLIELEFKHGPIEAYLHSHVHQPIPGDHHYKVQWPSHADMVQWIASGVPWGIVACDGTNCSDINWLDDDRQPPLEGRSFEHGTTDCFGLVRDYFWQEHDIRLKNYPRGWDWWNHGENLYLDSFRDAGFIEIPRKDAVPGDCLIYTVRTPHPNHAAIIVGKDMILHHLIGRKSCYDSRSKWARLETIAVRYSG